MNDKILKRRISLDVHMLSRRELSFSKKINKFISKYFPYSHGENMRY